MNDEANGHDPLTAAKALTNLYKVRPPEEYKYWAGAVSDDEWVVGGTGATPDDAFQDYLQNHAEDDFDNICGAGETLKVEIWTTRAPDPGMEEDAYTYMLDRKIEERQVSEAQARGDVQ